MVGIGNKAPVSHREQGPREARRLRPAASLHSGYIHRKAQHLATSTSKIDSGCVHLQVPLGHWGANDDEAPSSPRPRCGEGESNTFEVGQTAKGCDLFRIETPGAIRILGSIAQGTRPQFQLARPVTFWQTAKRCGPRPTPQLNKPNRLPSDTRRTRGDQHCAWYT